MRLPIQARSIGRESVESRSRLVVPSASATGIEPLGGGGGGGGGSTPPLGCWPSGTKCRGMIQHMVYCCADGKTWEERTGWCLGWYDAPPCR